MRNLYIFFGLIFSFSGNTQNNGFYLKVANDGLTPNTSTSVNFATQIDEDEIIYLQNYNIVENDEPFAQIIGCKTYLTRGDKHGGKSKVIFLQNDSLQLLYFSAVRNKDRIVSVGTGITDKSTYLVSFTFDLQLNLIHQDILRLGKSSPDNVSNNILDEPLYNTINGDLYFCHSSRGVIKFLMLSYNDEGIILKHNLNKVNNEFGIVPIAFTATPDSKQIIVLSLGSRLYFDMELNLVKDEWFDPVEETDSGFYYFPKFIPYKDETYISFGSMDFFDTGDHRVSRSLGIANKKLRVMEHKFVSDFAEGDFSDGPPRFTSGLFKGSDGYYTCYEAVPVGVEVLRPNTFFISKFDFDLNLVWDRRFIMDEETRFFNYYAELNPDNSFTLCGFSIVIDTSTGSEHYVQGHVIGLRPDGSPSTLSNVRTESNAVFSIQENPVGHTFTVNKSLNNQKSYSVTIIDLNGRRVAHNKDWKEGAISFDVNHLMSGTYIYTIADENRLIFSGKFIKI